MHPVASSVLDHEGKVMGSTGPGERVRVVLEGPLFRRHSFSVINREWCLALLRTGLVDLRVELPEAEAWYGDRISPQEIRHFQPLLDVVRRPGSAPAQVRVRHLCPPQFDPPHEPWWVMGRPWDYGSLPLAWVGPMRDRVDELWAASSFVKRVYVSCGIAPDKVHVVPYGVDPAVFHPAGPSNVPTERGFRFLFVGGTVWRKGFDILLETYLRTFRRDDDVCLVVKDFGVSSFYRPQAQGEAIRRAQADPRNPQILYLPRDLGPEEMAGVYRGCHCLVHPYRGEGFGIPMIEAMACGLPIIVPEYGPCLDFSDRDTAFFVSAKEVPLPEKRIGPFETVDYPTVAQVDAEELGARMREVFEHAALAREMGRRASERIHREFTWDRAASIAAGRLQALARRGRPHARPAGSDLVQHGKERLAVREFRTARRLFSRALGVPGDRPRALGYFLLSFLPVGLINRLRAVQARWGGRGRR
jgi:glycosyltransferase involved in cell wall biosynthesis